MVISQEENEKVHILRTSDTDWKNIGKVFSIKADAARMRYGRYMKIRGLSEKEKIRKGVI